MGAGRPLMPCWEYCARVSAAVRGAGAASSISSRSSASGSTVAAASSASTVVSTVSPGSRVLRSASADESVMVERAFSAGCGPCAGHG